MITFESASVRAPEAAGAKVILHPVSLTIDEPIVSIIGANGSGKSTLARLINGLVTPTSGHVLVDGLDVARQGAAVRRRVGFMFTDPAAQLIMPTVIEDVALSLRKTHDRRADRDTEARKVLERFGLSAFADQSVHTLSGGQRQLLALASVLATEPSILVADEPTTLLDLRNARRIGDVLTHLPQHVVLVTHDLELATRAARTLVIDEGRVVFDGAPMEAVEHYRSMS